MVKFKVPTRYRISGIEYHTVIKDMQGTGNRGECNHLTRETCIEEKLAKDERRRTFLHEAIHQAADVYAFTLSEENVRRLTHAMDEVIQQLEVEE